MNFFRKERKENTHQTLIDYDFREIKFEYSKLNTLEQIKFWKDKKAEVIIWENEFKKYELHDKFLLFLEITSTITCFYNSYDYYINDSNNYLFVIWVFMFMLNVFWLKNHIKGMFLLDKLKVNNKILLEKIEKKIESLKSMYK